ncbi:MAG: hypothetical protein M3O26_18605, partial [Pseudomonadota bacterium]|nr:hypothetical protein [Pseudomonadota bacterium]
MRKRDAARDIGAQLLASVRASLRVQRARDWRLQHLGLTAPRVDRRRLSAFLLLRLPFLDGRHGVAHMLLGVHRR